MPETLLESELFGHVKGSFTGAYRDKPGKLEIADGGTMFLDEIGEMTLRMQGLLLRFLETGEIQKVGADGTMSRVNVRVIAATNRNLRDMIAEGTVPRGPVLPPERHSPDGAAAAGAPRGHSTAHRSLPRSGYATAVGLAGAADCAGGEPRCSCEYSWPGNVRELENVIERLVVTGRNEVIDARGSADGGPHAQSVGLRPKRERRRTVADDLFKKLVEERESFWTACIRST